MVLSEWHPTCTRWSAAVALFLRGPPLWTPMARPHKQAGRGGCVATTASQGALTHYSNPEASS